MVSEILLKLFVIIVDTKKIASFFNFHRFFKVLIQKPEGLFKTGEPYANNKCLSMCTLISDVNDLNFDQE